MKHSHVINRMDKTFEDLFNNFFLKIVLLNYKYRESIPYSKEDQKTLKILNVLIPIYNRLEKDDSAGLEEVDAINTINNNYNLDPVEIQNDSDSEDDLEGDQQVKNLTENSLLILNTIRKNNWITIETDDSDIELETHVQSSM